MSDQPSVYEIDLTKKYILQFARPLGLEELQRIVNCIEEWKTSDRPFLLLAGGDVKLVRVEGDHE